MLRIFYSIILVTLIFASQLAYSQIKNQAITGQSFSGEVTINASPDEVWQVLTDANQLTEICGYEYVGGAKTFSKVGDEAQVKVWDDAGSFMLTRVTDKTELRFNFDPENGSYLCNCRWVLSKAKDGTKVWFEERYTESGPQTKEALESQVKELNEGLMKLKQEAEKK